MKKSDTFYWLIINRYYFVTFDPAGLNSGKYSSTFFPLFKQRGKRFLPGKNGLLSRCLKGTFEKQKVEFIV